MIDQLHYLQVLSKLGATIQEIGWLCGYADVYEFQTYFYEIYGTTPEVHFLATRDDTQVVKGEKKRLRATLKQLRKEMKGELPKDLLIVSRVNELAHSLTPKESIVTILGLSEQEINESVTRVTGYSLDALLTQRTEVTKSQLRKEQIKGAKKGNQVLLIHLGEHLLNQSKKSEPMQVNLSLSKLIEEAHRQIGGAQVPQPPKLIEGANEAT